MQQKANISSDMKLIPLWEEQVWGLNIVSLQHYLLELKSVNSPAPSGCCAGSWQKWWLPWMLLWPRYRSHAHRCKDSLYLKTPWATGTVRTPMWRCKPKLSLGAVLTATLRRAHGSPTPVLSSSIALKLLWRYNVDTHRYNLTSTTTKTIILVLFLRGQNL